MAAMVWVSGRYCANISVETTPGYNMVARENAGARASGFAEWDAMKLMRSHKV